MPSETHPAIYGLTKYWDVNLLKWVKGTQPTGGGGGGGAVTIADGADVAQGSRSDAAWVSGNGTVISLLKKIASAGGSAVSIADGSDAAEGATTDAAVVSDANGTVSGKLRGLVKILADVWDSVNHRLKVDGSGVTQPVSISATVAVSGPLTDTQLRATPVPVSGTVAFSNSTIAVTNAGVFVVQATLAAETTKVIGTVNQGTSPWVITGALTDTQLRATPVPVSGTVTATGPLTDTQLRATPVPVSGSVTIASGSVTVSGSVTISSGSVTVSGTVAVSNAFNLEATQVAVAASAASVDSKFGSVDQNPSAYSLLDRLSRIEKAINASAAKVATEATTQKLIAVIANKPKPSPSLPLYSTLGVR